MIKPSITLGHLRWLVEALEASGIEEDTVVILDQDVSDVLQTLAVDILAIDIEESED